VAFFERGEEDELEGATGAAEVEGTSGSALNLNGAGFFPVVRDSADDDDVSPPKQKPPEEAACPNVKGGGLAPASPPPPPKGLSSQFDAGTAKAPPLSAEASPGFLSHDEGAVESAPNPFQKRGEQQGKGGLLWM